MIKAEKNNYKAYGQNINISAKDDVLNKCPYSSFTFVDGTKTTSVLTPFNKPSGETVDKVYTDDDKYKTQETKYEYDKRYRCIKENVTVKYCSNCEVNSTFRK